MSREGQTYHKWSDADDAALTAAVTALEPLMDHYAKQLGMSAGHGAVSSWWSAVAGRLAPGVLVTGRACRRRWDTLTERRREAEAALRALVPSPDEDPPEANEDGWTRTARLVEEYERTVGEETRDGVDALRAQIDRLERLMEKLCKAWEVE